MKDLIISITEPINPIRGGMAYYAFDSGVIHIRTSYNITNILWHETIHKILYEDNITDTPRETTIQWDNIAYKLEDFLFR